MFGDAFIFLSFLKNTGLDPILASVFPDDGLYQTEILFMGNVNLFVNSVRL